MTIAASHLSSRQTDDAAIDAATAHYAKRREEAEVALDSAVVFRIGPEWLALPTVLLDRISDVPAIHTLPHRRAGAVAGLVNVGGELVVHVSLALLLGLDTGAGRTDDSRRRVVKRLIVLADSQGRLAITVDDVWGVFHYDPAKLRAAPATLSRAPDVYTTAMIDVEGRTVGLLDAVRVMHALSIAIS